MSKNNMVYGLWSMVYGLNFKKLPCILGLCFLFSILCSVVSFAQEDFVYDAKGKRNPFIPLITSGGKLLKLDVDKSEKNLLLEGIIYDQKGISYAIVNGEVIKTGDSILGYQVLKIENNKVLFIKEGEPLEIELEKEE